MEYSSKRDPAGRRLAGQGIALALAGALLLPISAAVEAAGMGRAQVGSYINQPLDMRIPLHGATAAELDQIRVEMASHERYRATGVNPPPIADDVRIEIRTDDTGMAYAHVTSGEPVREPFLRLLIELHHGQQQLVRDFTILLDPPPVAHAGADEPAAAGEPADTARVEEPATVADPASEPATPPATADAYGPVAPGMSLWRIADALQPPGTTIYQTMIAIHRTNPEAFADGDIERLRAGVRLDIPGSDEIADIPRAEAAQAYRQYIEGEAAETRIAEASPATAPEADAPVAESAPSAGEFAILAEFWPIGPLAVADNGGAVEIAPVESRLERIQDQLGALEERVAGGQAETSATLASQGEVLERLESRMQGIESRLDRVAADTAAVQSRNDLPMMTAGLIAAVAFLLGILAGVVLGMRRSPAAAGQPEQARVAANRQGTGGWRRLFGRHATASGPDRPAPDRPASAAIGAATAAGAAGAAGSAGADRPGAGADRPGAAGEDPAAATRDAGRGAEMVEESVTHGPFGEAQAEPDMEPDSTGETNESSGAGAASDPDDPVNMAEMYLAEDLPAEAADVLRMAIESYGGVSAPAHWWLKQLECLRAAGDDAAFVETARAFHNQVDNPETWNEIVRMGLAVDPDNPLFIDAEEAAAPADDAVAMETESAGSPDAVDVQAAPAADADEIDAATTPAADAEEAEAIEDRDEDEEMTVLEVPADAGPAVEPADADWFDDDTAADSAPATGEPAADGRAADPDDSDALEFDLSDMPEIEDARPVHGGAPEESPDAGIDSAADASATDQGADEAGEMPADEATEHAGNYEEIELSGSEEIPSDSVEDDTAVTEEEFTLDDSLLEAMTAEETGADEPAPKAGATSPDSDEIPELDDSFLEEDVDFDEDRQKPPETPGPVPDLDQGLAGLDESADDEEAGESGQAEPGTDEEPPRSASQG